MSSPKPPNAVIGDVESGKYVFSYILSYSLSYIPGLRLAG